MIRVTRVRNIFGDDQRPEVTILGWREGMLLDECVPQDAGVHVVSLNHRMIPAAEVDRRLVPDEAEVLVAEAPGIFAALLPPTASFAATLLAVVADIVVAVGLSYGIAALSAPTGPGRLKNNEDSGARNFEGIQDTAGPGRAIQIILGGPIRVGGHFLQSFERATSKDQVEEGITTLFTQLALGVGPIESVEAIQINGNAIELLPDIETHVRLGRNDEASIPGFHEIVHEVLYQRPIRSQDGVLEFVTNREVESIEVIFRFPGGLHRLSKDGVVRVKDVKFDIQCEPVGAAGTHAAQLKTFSSSKRNPVKKTVRFDELKLAQYRVRINRQTPDDESFPGGGADQFSASEVYAIQEITPDDRAHPGIARVAFAQVPSVQLNGQAPTNYTMLVKGFNRCRIYSSPSTFTLGWTNNNAWCCGEFLTNKRWGRGKEFTWEDNIDLESWLEWAAYCDELVSDGKGGLEKRSTFAYDFDTFEASDDQIEIFGEGCGVRIVKQGNRWHAIIDREDEMVWVGGEGNIVPGTFSLDAVPYNKRANHLDVVFQNEAQDYQRDHYSDELPDIPPGFQIISASRELRGVSRPSQVARETKRLLLHNKFADCSCELETNFSAVRVTAGSIFGVNLLAAGMGIASGRLLAVDAGLTLLEIDSEVVLEPGKSYEITVHHAQGDAITTKRLVNEPGIYTKLFAADSAWNGAIAQGDTYALGEFESSRMLFRCTRSVLTPDFRKKLSGLRYDPQVYTLDLAALPTPVKSSIPDPRLFPPDAQDLTLFERSEYAQDGTLLNAIDVDWTPPVSATLDHFEVWMRPTDAAGWSIRGEPRVGHFAIVGGVIVGNTYEVSVVSVSTGGARKSPEAGVRALIQVVGVTTQPSTPANLLATLIDGTLVLTVDPLPQSELGPQGGYEWRYGTSWNQSRLIDKTTSPRLELKSYTRGETIIFVRAFNSVGNKSPEPASVSIELRGQVEENILLTQEESPTWSGTKTGFVIEGGSNKLTLYEPVTSIVYSNQRSRLRRAGRWFGFGFPPPKPIVRLEGFYETGVITVSSGELVLFRPDVAFEFDAIYIGLGTFDAAGFSFDDPRAKVPFSGVEADKVRVLVEVSYSTTTTDPSAFTPWQELRDRGEVTAKHIRFRLHAIVESDAYSVKITSMTVSIDLPNKETSGRVTIASATSVDVNYPTSFFVKVKRLVAQTIGGAVGDRHRITADDETGFTLEMRDSAGALTTGTVDYSARGY